MQLIVPAPSCVSGPRRNKASASGCECRFHLGAVVISMPDSDLSQPPYPAIAGVQAGWVEPGHQPDDGISAAAQVLGGLSLAHLCGGCRMLGVVGIDDVRADRYPLASEDPSHPGREVLVGVRYVVHDDADRPGVAVERRGQPVGSGAAADEADQALPRGADGCGEFGRALRLGTRRISPGRVNHRRAGRVRLGHGLSLTVCRTAGRVAALVVPAGSVSATAGLARPASQAPAHSLAGQTK
jgi:hypothetical protein